MVLDRNFQSTSRWFGSLWSSEAQSREAGVASSFRGYVAADSYRIPRGARPRDLVHYAGYVHLVVGSNSKWSIGGLTRVIWRQGYEQIVRESDAQAESIETGQVANSGRVVGIGRKATLQVARIVEWRRNGVCLLAKPCRFYHMHEEAYRRQLRSAQAARWRYSSAMNRRTFGRAAAALAATTLRAAPAATHKTQSRMKLGTQHDSSDEVLRVIAALGVTHICSKLPSAKFDQNWSVENLSKLRERVESFGLVLEAVPLPLSSNYITKSENPAIMLAQSPERDRDIDNICRMLENISKAGIPAVKYNLTILGVVRSGTAPGRGGATYSSFNYAEAKQDPPLTEAGPVSRDEMWERITYFLQKVVPVAQANKVKLACHPHDPGMLEPAGFRGVHRVLGSVDGLKRFIEICASPYHGLNFCQGTVSEMLKDPNREIGDVIRYFGSRKKIFNVHFRNISGSFLNFRETFPDAGDVNMLAALRVYKEVGYDGMLMPDHVPKIEGDEAGHQAFAFAFGYIRGLLQAVES